MKTEQKIAEQSNVSPKTVRNAEKFADAVDKVAKNTLIKRIIEKTKTNEM